MTVAVLELKAHLRIQHDEEDALLTSLLAQAQAAAEDFCRTAFDASAPQAVRLAVLLMASFYYECRDSSEKSGYNVMTAAFRALLYPHRAIEQMF
jgi:uncharacterized phage protein (predicted DNA packaging)